MIRIDLRSDTVTKPDEAMRRAMATAEVGDDVFGEDPTVNRLQEVAARMLGREAALFVPSGTMANQICLRLLTRPGDEVICDQTAHLVRFEGGAAAVLSGLPVNLIEADRGILDPEAVEAAIRPDNVHLPVSRVVALENTHNYGGGAVYPLQTIRAITGLATDRGLSLHLDGARMFNACAAAGYGPAELAAGFDTVSFCLSKGLGAPVGSMVVSSRENIDQARRVRKRLGGGMRQAGILAAAGLYALEHNLDRLWEDHDRAGRLARGLAELKGVRLDPDRVETNIVVFDLAPGGPDQEETIGRLADRGVGVVPFGPGRLRAVTHLMINDRDIDDALAAFREVLG
jgi:threonine aldolase